MFNKTQILLATTGLSMMAGAGALGFLASNWVAALVLGGVGSSAFIVSTQHDR